MFGMYGEAHPFIMFYVFPALIIGQLLFLTFRHHREMTSVENSSIANRFGVLGLTAVFPLGLFLLIALYVEWFFDTALPAFGRFLMKKVW